MCQLLNTEKKTFSTGCKLGKRVQERKVNHDSTQQTGHSLCRCSTASTGQKCLILYKDNKGSCYGLFKQGLIKKKKKVGKIKQI